MTLPTHSSRAQPTSPWLEGGRLTVQVLPDDCTGCGVCVGRLPGTQ